MLLTNCKTMTAVRNLQWNSKTSNKIKITREWKNGVVSRNKSCLLRLFLIKRASDRLMSKHCVCECVHFVNASMAGEWWDGIVVSRCQELHDRLTASGSASRIPAHWLLTYLLLDWFCGLYRVQHKSIPVTFLHFFLSNHLEFQSEILPTFSHPVCI